ncbi:GntR family transcriptional regulator [Methylovirgula sp. 4M-Z18]|uniref:GntR family transcriptional regulator n=1 Tax=Methylovirgula sp. 4M-Z18 TaxID=2293567 RepID=UPI000E2EBF6F|nr:GntR family transcriptional regulator [Methylovirgula sp. 4M-Z18]RFB80764.1 GntR family transcriptional regulator [Methylovirgula sp. 4M-Z18]
MLVNDASDEVTPSGTSLAEDVYRRLHHDILNGYLPGGTIVQERRLAAKLGVSRTPLRDAIGRIEGQGLIVRNARGVLAVRVISLEDYLNCIALRLLTEPSAAALTSTRISLEEISRLDGILARIEAETDPPADVVSDFDDELHGAIGLNSGNPFLAQTIADMRRYTMIFERQLIPRRGAPGQTDHRAIVAALQARDPDRAQAAMAQHLQRVRERVLAHY